MGRVFHVTSSKFSNITEGKHFICFLSNFFYMSLNLDSRYHLKNLDKLDIIFPLVTFACNLR